MSWRGSTDKDLQQGSLISADDPFTTRHQEPFVPNSICTTIFAPTNLMAVNGLFDPYQSGLAPGQVGCPGQFESKLVKLPVDVAGPLLF